MLKDNVKVDWFVWVDVKLDGMVFINWLLIFGGLVWEWDS